MNNGLDFFTQGFITENVILLQGLGLYALTRHTKNFKTALRAGVAMLCAMLTAAVMVWAVSDLLVPYTNSTAWAIYVLIAAVSAFLWQRLLGFSGSMTDGLLDSALVGLLLIMGRDGVQGSSIVGFALSAGLGYLAALVVMTALRNRLEMAPVPKPLRGVPILLITAGLLAVALLGFRL